MIHRACKLARKWSGGALPNPAADAELPAYTFHERGEGVRAPRLEEVQALLDAAKAEDERMAAFVRVVAATGMRRGEACGIRWSNVEWGRGSIRIYESVVTAEGGGVIKPPKTRASIRSVTVDRDTLETLAELRQHQRELATSSGTALADDGFAFSYEPGGRLPPHPDTMSHVFTKIRQKAGVATDVHLHSLRHFQATDAQQLLDRTPRYPHTSVHPEHGKRHLTPIQCTAARHVVQPEHHSCFGDTQERLSPESLAVEIG